MSGILQRHQDNAQQSRSGRDNDKVALDQLKFVYSKENLAVDVRSYTANTTLTPRNAVVLVDCSSSNVDMTLVQANKWGPNKTPFIVLERTDTSINILTINAAAGDTIDGGAAITIAAGCARILITDSSSTWRSLDLQFGTAAPGVFSTISASGQITSTLPHPTPPFVLASSGKVVNLNADMLDNGDWASPGANIGTGTPVAGTFTSLTTLTDLSIQGNTTLGNASGDTLTVASNAVTWSNNPTHSGDHSWSGAMTFNGNTTIGNASGDALTIAPSSVTWTNNPTHSGNHTWSGNVTFNGNTTIGNASSDFMTVLPNTITWSSSPTHSGNHTFSGTVALSGGTIDGMVIGFTTPANGFFTGLNATGNVALGNAQTDQLDVGGGDIVKDSSGRTGFGKTPAAAKVEVNGVLRGPANNGGYFTKEATVTAGGNITITAATRGMAIFSNQSNSDTTQIVFDGGTGVVTIGEETTAGRLVTADPGAGTSKVWVIMSGTDLVFTNRWSTSQVLHVAVLSTAGTPS